MKLVKAQGVALPLIQLETQMDIDILNALLWRVNLKGANPDLYHAKQVRRLRRALAPEANSAYPSYFTHELHISEFAL
jgi:hypothetical protein